MIIQVVEKILRSPWTWRQALTGRPNDLNAPISDLFVWRNSAEWQTSFELIDIPRLFVDSEGDANTVVKLVFFDSSGQQFLSEEIVVLPAIRQTINLASYLRGANEEIGTFAVFHKSVPLAITSMGSYLAERGYVSYRYQGAPLRSYVHGNLDAIAQNTDGQLQVLGGSSFFQRQYRMQFELTPGSQYQLCIVNPTASEQKCVGRLVSIDGGRTLCSHPFKLAPGGVHELTFQNEVKEHARVIIESHIIMARPLVFNIQNSKMDVFHG
jgi:hypothetical protein